MSPLLTAAVIVALRTEYVTLQTIRTVFTVEGRRGLASVIGFFEASCFIGAAGIVFVGEPSLLKVLAFGIGFSAGTFLGMTIVRTLALGTVTVRIISTHGPIGVADALREDGFAVTTFDGQGRDGPVRLILVVVRKRQVTRLLAVIRPYLDRCFVTVGEHPLPPQVHPRVRS
jgi:uncharacterized protein YebE (UPF0316 family)